jgi:3-deoxy-D-manno-octulosonic-acid transferase
MGNMKFDLSVAATQDLRGLKAQWGAERPVWIAASTHDDEETQLLAHLQRLKEAIPGILLLIAPRRPERFQTVYSLVRQQGWQTGLRSQPETINQNVDVVVLDSMGELMSFYRMSDYAFVGASLVPIGGHNVLEPIAMGVPVSCGPHMQNAKSICEALSANQALYQGRSAADLVDHMIELYQYPKRRDEQVSRATQVLDANRGAVERYWLMIEGILTKKTRVF